MSATASASGPADFDTEPLVQVQEHSEPNIDARLAYDPDGTGSSRVKSVCGWYIVLSIARWLTIITVAFALGISVRGDILSYYRGTDAVKTCFTCLIHAQQNPSYWFEFGECQLLPSFANSSTGTPNLLVYGNGLTAPTSDLLYQNATLIIAYVLAIILLVLYVVTTFACAPTSSSPEHAMEQYTRVAFTVNIHSSFLAMIVLFFAHGLVMMDSCYIRPYPRGLALAFLLMLIVGLFFLIVASLLPCCVGWKSNMTLGFLISGASIIFASQCTILALLFYIGTSNAPQWVLILGVASFLSAFETVYFTLFTRRPVWPAILYRGSSRERPY